MKPEKLTPTSLEFLDVAGLVEGASRGEGLGNAFLGHLRSVDAIAHVVRLFEDSEVVHPSGSPDPVRDIDVIRTELILADLDVVERRREKVQRTARAGKKEAVEELEQLEWIHRHLNEGIPLRCAVRSGKYRAEADGGMFKEWGLLTDRPVLYVLNLDEDQIRRQDSIVQEIRMLLKDEEASFLPLCAKLEREIMDLDPEEQETFREEIQEGPSGLERLVQEGYRLLGLITFYTIVGSEIRAWTLRQGDTAYQAAGKIHTDMQRGFIKAEVIHFDDFLRVGSEEKVREEGLLHVEGKEYTVQDRDILRIRFQ